MLDDVKDASVIRGWGTKTDTHQIFRVIIVKMKKEGPGFRMFQKSSGRTDFREETGFFDYKSICHRTHFTKLLKYSYEEKNTNRRHAHR